MCLSPGIQCGMNGNTAFVTRMSFSSFVYEWEVLDIKLLEQIAFNVKPGRV